MGPQVLATGTSTTGWVVGYTIGIVIVLVVVALVVPILLLAKSIGDEAPKINDALEQAVHNTAPLGALRTTIDYAVTIIGGLQRGRATLGDDHPQCRHALDRRPPLADRQHPRPRGGCRGRRPGEPAHLAGAADRRPGGAGARHAQGRGGQRR